MSLEALRDAYGDVLHLLARYRGTGSGIRCEAVLVSKSVTISLLAGFAGFPPPRQPGLLLALIHRSAWKGCSPKFACTEVRRIRYPLVTPKQQQIYAICSEVRQERFKYRSNE